MREVCESCGKDIEVSKHHMKGIVIYFCGKECERQMIEQMDRSRGPIWFVTVQN